jgi:eukaryotic-like serine/threonine-protein kinase
MSSTWSRLESLFHEASLLEGEEQERFVERETAGDVALGEELRDLLRGSNSAGLRIAAVVERVTARVVGGSNWAGRTFGPYRIVREIGRGGMGVVFEAWRDDSEYHKRVALKVAPDWRDLEWLRERFRNERQILARLEHPNIARFLDGGTEAGIPYFAMEYVDGRPVIAWAREHGLGVPERVAMFRQICAAVSYAHENLVIHRDLKPGNILVDSTGAPKLLDFGIATLLDAVTAQACSTTGARLWTPDYASPEQVRGEPVTVRTDVYSLGLLLYELLCGERAQGGEQLSLASIDRAVCETDPDPPSVRAATRGDKALARVLHGDLDRIVATAIRKEPMRRYSSARALDADLERYLAGRPVSARPNTLPYQFSKLVRRNRIASVAAALVLLAIAGGVGSTLHEARRAERRFQEVRSLANAFIFDVHDRIQFLPGATEARKAIVSTGLQYLENLRRDAGGDRALLRELATAYEKIGEVQGNPMKSSLGDSAGALQSYRAAESILNPLVVKGDVDAKALLALTVDRIGSLEHTHGKTEGLQDLNRARLLAREVIAARPTDLAALRVGIDVDGDLLRYYSDLLDFGKMLEFAQEGEHKAEQLAAAYPGRAESQDLLAESEVNLARAFRANGDLIQAEKIYRDALTIRQRLVEQNPNQTSYRRSLLLVYGHLGDLLGLPETHGMGNMPEAVETFDKAAAIAESMVREDPADRVAQYDQAAALARSSACLLEMPDGGSRALAHLSQAEVILSNLEKLDPANQRYQLFSLSIESLMGKGLLAAGHYTEAARRLERVRSSYKGFLGGPNDASARGWGAASALRLAQIKAQRGDSAAARALTEETVALIQNRDVNNSEWGDALFAWRVGTMYRRIGQNASAAIWFQKSVDTWRKMKVPSALEGRRQKELAEAEHDFAALQHGHG